MENGCCLTDHGREEVLVMRYIVHNAQNKCCDLVISAVITSAVMSSALCVYFILFHLCHCCPGLIFGISRPKSRLQEPGDL